MADSCCFVQLPHPGREAGPRGGRAWSTLAATHARKFMQVRGEWIQADGSAGSGDLWAWGEWEPQSRLLRRLCQPDTLAYPAYLWLPYYAIPDNGCEELHNTDPFIFGDRILYSNCGQPRSPRLRSLDRGSVIAFGSPRRINGCLTRCWWLPGSSTTPRRGHAQIWRAGRLWPSWT